MSSTVSFRPTTAEDIEALGLNLTWRIRAITAVRDGEPIAIGGLAYPPVGIAVAFIEGWQHIAAHPLSATRAARRELARARERGVRRIVAMPEPGVEPAARWLARLGFRPDGDLWLWEA